MIMTMITYCFIIVYLMNSTSCRVAERVNNNILMPAFVGWPVKILRPYEKLSLPVYDISMVYKYGN
jgi:hypothetical protein